MEKAVYAGPGQSGSDDWTGVYTTDRQIPGRRGPGQEVSLGRAWFSPPGSPESIDLLCQRNTSSSNWLPPFLCSICSIAFSFQPRFALEVHLPFVELPSLVAFLTIDRQQFTVARATTAGMQNSFYV